MRIAFSGSQNSGKTTLARMLLQHDSSFHDLTDFVQRFFFPFYGEPTGKEHVLATLWKQKVEEHDAVVVDRTPLDMWVYSILVNNEHMTLEHLRFITVCDLVVICPPYQQPNRGKIHEDIYERFNLIYDIVVGTVFPYFPYAHEGGLVFNKEKPHFLTFDKSTTLEERFEQLLGTIQFISHQKEDC